MARQTFTFTSASLRSLRLEQEMQDWEEARRELAHRRAMSRRPLPPARSTRPQPRTGKIQEVRAPPPQIRCRDPAVHNTFMCGDMAGIYAVLKEPGMVNALMETVQEEMVWAPEMGMWTLSTKTKQTSALRLAASRGHSGCVEELLFRGAEVNEDPGGRTALHDACLGGHANCVHLLLNHGADPDVLAEDGNAPLHLCNTADTYQCAELLVKSGADVNISHRQSRLTPLHMAARRGLDEHVELLITHDADVAAQNLEGETPLNAACCGAERASEVGRYLRVVKRLLEVGADPRKAGKKQHTPLHNACGNCSPRIAHHLLQHGARADAANCFGYTPMDCLLQVGVGYWQVVEDYPDQHPEDIARSLFNHGAQPPSPMMLKLCLLSPATLEVMINSYHVVPPCEDWIDKVPQDLKMANQALFESVQRMTGQPRSLQHLCRCSVRSYLGEKCHSAINDLNIPSCMKDYLLLCLEGEIR
ncbi:ankyrin repeat and SOCS box protein 16 isoform X1 [Alosa alosa]|uniref:ankyrin repeat and SOCS box protein 16 isoform X1 n=2 Tax=Alosa alosa TaxID=278164 RepID=UPI0020155029|nr:ankyrin repeat and SOCS box protein 16 isoform X1 [Alosa alosa]